MRGVGEPVNGFPNWPERVIHEWMNRARVDPQLEMNACGAACVERDCYAPLPPLSWNESLNRAARFHSDSMVRQGYFAHTSSCTLVSNIGSLYPASCDGSASCACVGGVKACSPSCTQFWQRVGLFGGSAGGEIIASPSDPNQAFYLWLFERGDTENCEFTGANGHRWLILRSTGAVGVGVAGYSTGDFGAGSAPAKIPSGSHYPQQAAAVEAWANWSDTAGPSAAGVNVDGACTPMTLRRGTQTNGAWAATLTGVGTGCHRYYFSFRDAAGATVTYPTTGSLAIGSGATCPDWSSMRPAACTTGTEPIPSPTASPTPPPTRTQTATPTRSRTATPTRTATAAPSATATASHATPMPTPSVTPIAPGANLEGSLRYFSNDLPVPNILIHAGEATSVRSDLNGHFGLADVPAGGVLVYPAGSGGTSGAISALDAAYVLQYVAGARMLSAEQALACDVTGNGSLSALDATRILQYTVGLLPRFAVASACDSDWAFIPVPAPVSDQSVVQPQPGADACTPGAIAYGRLTASIDEQNFRALVFGDCTGNWRPPGGAAAFRASIGRDRAAAASLRPLGGRRWALPIAVDGHAAAHALDLRVDYDPTALRVLRARLVGAARGGLLAANGEQAGRLHLGIASSASLPADGSPVAVVVFSAVRAGRVAVPSISVDVSEQ